jgi:hypothetical protein
MVFQTAVTVGFYHACRQRIAGSKVKGLCGDDLKRSRSVVGGFGSRSPQIRNQKREKTAMGLLLRTNP